ncbi:leucine-rich repeat extensin-like protein 5 [Humulus lupulus]|uniref:leucine-rich repeat extensin-like protein 5 n=1 Tax=Humulus lupulus TaxID=3486 RepID=UPI002B406333|nr:leucine-rich repeat extensin-like protein 5 [Humulus lupulus]
MRPNNYQCLRACNILFLYLIVVAIISFSHCEARKSVRKLINKAPSTHQKSLFLMTAAKLNLVKYLNYDSPSDPTNSGSYGVSSPFTLPPYDSLPPVSLPENSPPYCVNPPNTPQTPSTTLPTPIGSTPTSPYPPFYLPPAIPIQNPPPGENPSPIGVIPSPIGQMPSPTGQMPSPIGEVPSPLGFSLNPTPPQILPSPSEPILSPPYFEPSPPGFTPNPPSTVPSPYGFHPGPPVFLPPIVYPPPIGRPPRNSAPSIALWCVAKPSVPDPIIQEAMNYACGSGADCDSIQPSGSCFEPDSLIAHASYAFNSYWQRTKVAGGTCDFGGTGMLITVDPSYDGCHFVYF